MYEVIGTSGSRALRVLWMLEELGQPYAHVSVDPGTPEVLAANPAGKIPVLRVDGVSVTDSSAILQFLADRHGALTHPAGTLDRAEQDGLTHLLLDEFDAVIWTAARHSFILPKDWRRPEVKDSLKWEFERNQARLATRLGAGPYLMGQGMTVPDIILTHCLIWAARAKFPPPDPALADYLARMMARPALTRALAR